MRRKYPAVCRRPRRKRPAYQGALWQQEENAQGRHPGALGLRPRAPGSGPPRPAASRVRGPGPNTPSGKHRAVPTSLHTRGEARGRGARDTQPQGLRRHLPGPSAPPPPRGNEGMRGGSMHQTHREGERLTRQGVGRLLVGHGAAAGPAAGLPFEEGLCAREPVGDPGPAATFCTSVFSVSK